MARGRIDIPPDLGGVSARRAIDAATLRDAEVTPADGDAIWRSVERLYRTGVHPAIGLCIRRRGHVVVEGAIGHQRGHGPAEPAAGAAVLATPATPFGLFSASKAITAMVIHLLVERGALRLDDPVAEYVPGFARHGKQGITLAHLLCHRAGLPRVPGSFDEPEVLLDPAACVARLCDARPTQAPGRRLEYHALAGGYLLGAVVRRATGRTLQEVIRGEILDPLGFELMGYGVPPARERDVAVNYVTGSAMPFPLTWITRRALGLTWAQATDLSNDPRFYRRIIPSANVFGTANEASRFFELLLRGGELDGKRVMEARTLRAARVETAYLEPDRVLVWPVRYGQGLMLGAPLISPFGPGLGSAFGHIGFMNIFCYADPERDLAVALMTSGKLLFDTHLPALVNVLWQIARHCRPVRAKERRRTNREAGRRGEDLG
ncbi:MAG TPA: serine hydrolase domain-containing protein [Polyangia bacterium]|jgi:CubicO group peptidase (beta-lactamase class C family)